MVRLPVVVVVVVVFVVVVGFLLLLLLLSFVLFLLFNLLTFFQYRSFVRSFVRKETSDNVIRLHECQAIYVYYIILFGT